MFGIIRCGLRQRRRRLVSQWFPRVIARSHASWWIHSPSMQRFLSTPDTSRSARTVHCPIDLSVRWKVYQLGTSHHLGFLGAAREQSSSGAHLFIFAASYFLIPLKVVQFHPSVMPLFQSSNLLPLISFHAPFL